MLNFKNDYSEIAHIKILESMVKYQKEANVGYGMDSHSTNAANLIKEAINNKNVDVHFITGGTQANKTVISHCLRPYEAVICCNTGHINVHETGAVEGTGHKVLTAQNLNGKILPEDITSILNDHLDEHMVKPKMVYVSNATETGSIYTKKELTAISKLCKDNNLYLFLDGARLGTALVAETNDLTLEDIQKLCDIFYIGGTKNGALLGEAVVIVNNDLKKDFRYSIKLNGGMYAKGFVAGIQFETLFTDDLFFDLARNANDCAKLLKNGMKQLGLKLPFESETNQQFVVLGEDIVKKIREFCVFEFWGNAPGGEKIYRFVCSWATNKNDVESFLQKLAIILHVNNSNVIF